MEVAHAHFSEVAGMIFVEVGPVMMLSTRHATSTRMLSVFANAAVASGDMTAAGWKERVSYVRTWLFPSDGRRWLKGRRGFYAGSTYCLRVLVSRVGIMTAKRWVVFSVQMEC